MVVMAQIPGTGLSHFLTRQLFLHLHMVPKGFPGTREGCDVCRALYIIYHLLVPHMAIIMSAKTTTVLRDEAKPRLPYGQGVAPAGLLTDKCVRIS